ncbi:MAG: VCBS domain-containing protein, partial [Deltaproteobacteria bacterium]|nr:VCBS domain-containing protein [Deltaproteobacteria bacterium]
ALAIVGGCVEPPYEAPRQAEIPADADWDDIGAQIRALDYHLVPFGAQWRADNPAWQIGVVFQEQGVEVTPLNGGDWSLSLTPSRWGASGALAPLDSPKWDASANRAEAHRGTVQEWYVNEERGVEQGFTLTEAPAGPDGWVEVDIEVTGTLRPELMEGRRAIEFVSPEGTVRARYYGLQAWDVAGAPLASEMAVRGCDGGADCRIALLVDASEARWPITVDPWLVGNEKRLVPSGTEALTGIDKFGQSVALSGDILIVGAPDHKIIGVATGAVFVFERDYMGTAAWGLRKRLTVGGAVASAQVGYAVAVDGDTAVVGGPGTSTTGAAWIFQQDHPTTDNWGLRATLSASGTPASLGKSVAIDGNLVVVGDPDQGTQAGAAYLFSRDQTGTDLWGELKKFTASVPAIYDEFGFAVSVDGDKVAVGAPQKGYGTAYIYEKDYQTTDAWGERKIITESTVSTDVDFGWSIAINGDRVAVGAPLDASSIYGAVYLYERNQLGADNWGKRTSVTDSSGASGDQFGYAVDLYPNHLVVGAPGNDDVATGAGAALTFEKDQGGTDTWGFTKQLTASDGTASDTYGTAVAVDGDLVAIGSPVANTDGAVYVYDDLAAPTVAANNGHTLNEGASAVLTTGMLQVADTDTPATSLTYSITGPSHGTLSPSTGFTQAQLDGGSVSYINDGSENSSDSFGFTVSDGTGQSVSGTFTFSVTGQNDTPTVNHNTGATVGENSTVTVTQSQLEVIDAEDAPNLISYTVDSVPAAGTLYVSAAPVSNGGGFTQLEVNNSAVTYSPNGAEVTTASFTFTASDNDSATVGGTFTFTVVPVNDLPTVNVNTGATVGENGTVALTQSHLEVIDSEDGA